MDDLLKNYGENAVDDVTAPTVATAERSKPIVMKKLDITCAPDVELAQPKPKPSYVPVSDREEELRPTKLHAGYYDIVPIDMFHDSSIESVYVNSTAFNEMYRAQPKLMFPGLEPGNKSLPVPKKKDDDDKGKEGGEEHKEEASSDPYQMYLNSLKSFKVPAAPDPSRPAHVDYGRGVVVQSTRVGGGSYLSKWDKDHPMASTFVPGEAFPDGFINPRLANYGAGPIVEPEDPNRRPPEELGFDMVVKKNKKDVRKREAKGDVTDVDNYKGPWAKWENEIDTAPAEDAEEIEKRKAYVESIKERGGSKKAKKEEVEGGVCELSDEDRKIYEGGDFLIPPKGLRDAPASFVARIPSKLVYQWVDAHNKKPISKVLYFPKFGHLILSCGYDNKIKLWDIVTKRLLMTYHGHANAVKDICWNRDGSKFISCGFDKTVRVWETGSGKMLYKYDVPELPFCVKWTPLEALVYAREPTDVDQFLVGCGDRCVYQYTMSDIPELKQKYDRHLSTVSAVEFVDHNRAFVASSDDKTIRVYAYGMNVERHLMQEPWMNASPALATNHACDYMLAQSMDNRLMLYNASEKVSVRSTFMGHAVTGYACQPCWSTDDKFVASGDANGNVYFWEFPDDLKRARKRPISVIKTVHEERKACMCVQWHPINESEIVTCGWDGKLTYWA